MLQIIKEYKNLDKAQLFGPGPWVKEADKIQMLQVETDFDCLIVRHPHSGHLCGYVGVPETHPYFKKGYDEIGVEVHGGLTFANLCAPHGKEEESVCHVPLPGRSDQVWWLGFDCAHAGDKSPIDKKYGFDYSHVYQTYKTIDYVKEEIEKLALQLKKISQHGN